MQLRDSQYQQALKFLRSADNTLQQLINVVKRKGEGPRIARSIDEVTVLLKKAKKELGVS
jgi:hypothetical protein